MTSPTTSDHDALVDDAVHEINQRWGEPWGDDMLPLDQKLVRETAEAILGLARGVYLREVLERIHHYAEVTLPGDVSRTSLTITKVVALLEREFGDKP